jgi:hypothetical protein
MTARSLAVLAATPADYHSIGVTHTIAPWEDGARTDNSPGTYEWWYFDAHLDNGAILVIVFQNKDFADPDQPLDPIIRVDLTLPDGRAINRLVHFEPSQWQAAEEHADVRIGERNRFAGDLNEVSARRRADRGATGVSRAHPDAGSRVIRPGTRQCRGRKGVTRQRALGTAVAPGLGARWDVSP